ncbi:hypothetical protein T484DRAFT_1835414 [Baffinella frigidus]|nr:hypothetical protein T484DRAFT_1835414 [Cryptophyta sp. CCMP2293]
MSISSLLSSKGIYLNNYMDERSEYQIGSAQAKTEYFLTPDDLATLQVKQSQALPFSPGGVSRAAAILNAGIPLGFQDLERCALRKFGEEGLADKRAKRDKRVANKRKREDDAKKVLLSSSASVYLGGGW